MCVEKGFVNEGVLVEREKIRDENGGMFWRGGVFEIGYLFLFTAAAINGRRVAQRMVRSKKFPR